MFFLAVHFKSSDKLVVHHYSDVLAFKAGMDEVGGAITAGQVLAWNSGVVP